jgi:outer membrane protein TolC
MVVALLISLVPTEQQIPPEPPSQAAPQYAAESSLPLLEAVQITLRAQPTIAEADAQVQARTADTLAAHGVFDPVAAASFGHDHNETPVLPGQMYALETETIDDVTEFDLGASATLPWGTVLAPSVRLSRTREDREPGDPFVPGLLSVPWQQAQVSLAIRQPLLRGRGEVGTASGLVAARHERESAIYARSYVAQQAVFETVTAYWELAAAAEQVGISEKAQARARRLLDETRELVLGKQRPAADVTQVEGHLYNRMRFAAQARRDRRRAVHALHIAMGLPSDGTTPEWATVNSFPRPTALGGGDLAGKATTSRADVRASRASVEAARAALAGAERNTLPALDLSVSIGYVGATLKDGPGPFVGVLGANIPGVTGGAHLTLQLPILNDAQLAARDRDGAEFRLRTTLFEDLERRVRIGVAAAVDELRLSADAVAAAEREAERYARAVDDEQTKLRAGLSTVIDVVLTEDNLTQAELGLTGSRLEYALALARLRFEAGEVPSGESEAAASLNLFLDAEGASDGAR